VTGNDCERCELIGISAATVGVERLDFSSLALPRKNGDQCKSLAGATVAFSRVEHAAIHLQSDAQADCGGLH